MPTGFHEVLFPTNISRGSTGGPRFRTNVITADSGVERRSGQWDRPLLAWEVGHQINSIERMNLLVAFFRARRGRLYGFRFRDWTDYTAGMTFEATGLVYDGTYHPVLDLPGGGRGLYKRYESGGVVELRRILKPVAGTVVFSGGGGTVDPTTGLVTGSATGWAGQFDVPVRFDTDEMVLSVTMVESGSWSGIPVVELRE